MKIISKFKDYYDGVGRFNYGTIERDDMYIRKTKAFCKNNGDDLACIYDRLSFFDFRTKFARNYYTRDGWISLIQVIFCGKAYTIAIVPNLGKKLLDLDKQPVLYLTSFKQVEEFVNKYQVKGKYDDDVTLERTRGWLSRGTSIKDSWNTFKDEDALAINLEYKSPVVIFSKSGYVSNRYEEDLKHNQYVAVVNPVLSEIHFQKHVDTYTAYQELSMFVGSVLTSSDDAMINISDKDRIQQHGFDKWTFRKQPTKKRK